MNISVIIASRNRITYISNLLSDLNNQVLVANEIILIDQSDIPYQIPEAPGMIHIIDNQRGPCHARNLGLEASSGDIIVFLDDDIRIYPDFLQNISMPIIENHTKVVVGAMLSAQGQYPNAVYLPWKQDRRNWLLSLTANPGDPGTHPTFSFTTCCSAIHRSVYENIGGFDVFFDPDGAGEDREYGLRIFHAGFSSLYVGKACVRHLGAPSGGRRGSASGFRYQNILEANSVYIVAKYFGWQVLQDFCSTWFRSILKKGKSINLRIWVRTYFRWLEARRYVVTIKKLKRDNGW